MFKAQFKSNSPYETWNVIGVYNDEPNAIASAMQKKKRGVLLVRVVDKRGAVRFIS